MDVVGRVATRDDCNNNGIPDDEDIENCDGDPACDDCNLNGVPDSCDISEGTSSDEDMDGIPNECVFYDDGGDDDDWSTPENWDDDDVPNNLDLMDDESVTIDIGEVDLDVEVEVDTLRLLSGAALNISGTIDEDFAIEELGGIRIASEAAIQSRVLVGNGREVTVDPGVVNVRSGGVYEADPAAQQPTQALLEAGSILIESRCGEPIPGKITLSGEMVTSVFGDLVIDATEDCVDCALCALRGGSGQRDACGGETPPILRVKDSAVVQIGGNFAILGAGQVIHESSAPIEVGGDFINNNPCPECCDLSGAIVFGPPSDRGAAPRTLQTFEVAGYDVGPVPAGFDTNFAVGTLEVTDDATVSFVDTFPNTGSGATEALYVDTLILRESATVTLVDCRVYYNTLIDEGALIESTGEGSLVPVGGSAIPAVSTWGMVAMWPILVAIGTLVIRSSHVDRTVRDHK